MKETRLYRHFDKDGKLLYVGISLNAMKRLSEHAKWSHWFNAIATVTIEVLPDRKSALEAERNAVESERPMYNMKPLGRKPTFSAKTLGCAQDLLAEGLGPTEVSDLTGLSRACVYRIKDNPEKMREILSRWGMPA